MIVRTLLNGQWFCAHQTSHALMAAQFCRHWGNREFATPSPYDLVMNAIAAQIAAARSRLLRELARNLRCMGNDDLLRLFQKQTEGNTAASQRFKRAFGLLKGPSRWSVHDYNDAARYVDELSEGQRQQRINLASELEAALSDPRWLAR